MTFTPIPEKNSGILFLKKSKQVIMHFSLYSSQDIHVKWFMITLIEHLSQIKSRVTMLCRLNVIGSSKKKLSQLV